jgi:hypothetical protein
MQDKRAFFSYISFPFINRVFENGVETVMSYENDVLKSKTVNGVPQAISY